jgi:hypothetical protein
VRGVAQLHRDGEIEPRRPASDAGDLHRMVRMFAVTSSFAQAPLPLPVRAYAKFG